MKKYDLGIHFLLENVVFQVSNAVKHDTKGAISQFPCPPTLWNSAFSSLRVNNPQKQLISDLRHYTHSYPLGPVTQNVQKYIPNLCSFHIRGHILGYNHLKGGPKSGYPKKSDQKIWLFCPFWAEKQLVMKKYHLEINFPPENAVFQAPSTKKHYIKGKISQFPHLPWHCETQPCPLSELTAD